MTDAPLPTEREHAAFVAAFDAVIERAAGRVSHEERIEMRRNIEEVPYGRRLPGNSVSTSRHGSASARDDAV